MMFSIFLPNAAVSVKITFAEWNQRKQCMPELLLISVLVYMVNKHKWVCHVRSCSSVYFYSVLPSCYYLTIAATSTQASLAWYYSIFPRKVHFIMNARFHMPSLRISWVMINHMVGNMESASNRNHWRIWNWYLIWVFMVAVVLVSVVTAF
jgi:hypothetical protein